MPIYGYGVLGAPWTLCKGLNIKKLVKFIHIVKNSAKSEFKLNQVFLNSIKYNEEFKECYIASYDISKTNIEVARYQEYIEKIISLSNQVLLKNTKYDKYKFDIAGNWTIGKIVIMEKK